MAYDPNDPADKRIVDKLIKDAVDAALEEARTEHEAEVEGLRNKRTELLDKLKLAKAAAIPLKLTGLKMNLKPSRASFAPLLPTCARLSAILRL
jgi:hypothetical protein